MIVDQHQPVVERYYGKGKMDNVIKRLLEECGRVVQNTLSAWREERSIERKVSIFVLSTIFLGLTSFQISDIASSPFSLNASRKLHPQPGNEDDGLDPREIDKTLSEIAGMCGRWNLFRKFLVEQLQVRVYSHRATYFFNSLTG